ncbi:MAG: DUF4097 domain-containing protein [Treponema sp.]|nr:DUF4097 domain-containing protein [Treponema sp.]
MKGRIKKSILLIFIFFSCFVKLSAGGFSETKRFDVDSIENIQVELRFASLTVSTWNGNQIVVISESNNKSLFPLISLGNQILEIKANNLSDKKSGCLVSLLFPENYVAKKVTIKTNYGKLDIKKLSAKTVSLLPGMENSLSNITADFFEIPMPDETDINLINLDCKSFNITLVAGNVNLSLLHTPTQNSKISAKHGNLNIAIPSDSSFTVLADSYHSKFINNFTGKVDSWVRDGITYKHNGGGSKIDIQTFYGDITIGEKN